MGLTLEDIKEVLSDFRFIENQEPNSKQLANFSENADITKLFSYRNFIEFMTNNEWEDSDDCFQLLLDISNWLLYWRKYKPHNYNNFYYIEAFNNLLNTYKRLLKEVNSQQVNRKNYFKIIVSLSIFLNDSIAMQHAQTATDFSKIFKLSIQYAYDYLEQFLQRLRIKKTIDGDDRDYLERFKKCCDHTITFPCAFVTSNNINQLVGSIENCTIWMDWRKKDSQKENDYPIIFINDHEFPEMQSAISRAINYAVTEYNKKNNAAIEINDVFVKIGAIKPGVRESTYDGGSIGAAMFCASLSLFQNKPFPQGILLSGQVGTELQVDGILEKAKAGWNTNRYHHFIIPSDNDDQEFRIKYQEQNTPIVIRTYSNMEDLAALYYELESTVGNLNPDRSNIPKIQPFKGHVPHTPNDNFVDFSALWQIHDILNLPTNKSLSLHGSTQQIAVEYINRFGCCYWQCVWIDFNDKEKTQSEVAQNIAYKIFHEKIDDLSKVWERLNSNKYKNKRTLIIFNCFPSINEPGWTPNSSNIHLIITNKSIDKICKEYEIIETQDLQTEPNPFKKCLTDNAGLSLREIHNVYQRKELYSNISYDYNSLLPYTYLLNFFDEKSKFFVNPNTLQCLYDDNQDAFIIGDTHPLITHLITQTGNVKLETKLKTELKNRLLKAYQNRLWSNKQKGVNATPTIDPNEGTENRTIIRIVKVEKEINKITFAKTNYDTQAKTNLIPDLKLRKITLRKLTFQKKCLPELDDNMLANNLGISILFIDQSNENNPLPLFPLRAKDGVAVFPGEWGCTLSFAANFPETDTSKPLSLQTLIDTAMNNQILKELYLNPEEKNRLKIHPLAIMREWLRLGKTQLFMWCESPFTKEKLSERLAQAKNSTELVSDTDTDTEDDKQLNDFINKSEFKKTKTLWISHEISDCLGQFSIEALCNWQLYKNWRENNQKLYSKDLDQNGI